MNSKVRRVFLILAILSGAIILSYSSIRIYYSTLHSISGYSMWCESSSQPYAYIEADTYYDLGYRTGQILSSQIWQLKLILRLSASQFDFSYGILKDASEKYLSYIPSEYLEEMQGIADGFSAKTGLLLSFADVLVQNIWMDEFYGQILPNVSSPVGCSVFAAINNASLSSTSPTFGQNFDYVTEFAASSAFVLANLTSGTSFFTLRFGAGLCLPLGKNAAGVHLLTSVIQTKTQGIVGCPALIRTRIALEESTTSREFLKFFLGNETFSSTLSSTLTVIDNNLIIGLDIAPTAVHISYPSTRVRTNTFVEPEWQSYLLFANYSKDRQNAGEVFLSNVTADNFFSSEELNLVLTQTPLFCRTGIENGDTSTLAFYTFNAFGLGKPNENPWAPHPL